MTQDAVNALSTFITPTLVIAVLGLSWLFYYLAFKFDESHFFLKFLCIFFGIISLQVLPTVLLNDVCLVTGHPVNVSNVTGFSALECYDVPSSAPDSILNIVQWFFRIFVTYISIYLFWHWVKQSETFMRYFK
jgi:hypothetical protein